MKDIKFDIPDEASIQIHWILKILGFSKWVHLKVLSDPKIHKDHWLYKTEIESVEIRWFSIKIKQTNHSN